MAESRRVKVVEILDHRGLPKVGYQVWSIGLGSWVKTEEMKMVRLMELLLLVVEDRWDL